MNSIRSKFTLLTISAVIVSVLAIGVVSTLFIRQQGDKAYEHSLSLSCDVSQKTMDSYLLSIKQSVETVSNYILKDLSGFSHDELRGHLSRVDGVFSSIAGNTRGALTYYYRLAPEVSKNEGGFWYAKSSNGEFEKHEISDINAFSEDDISRVGWYSKPKKMGFPVWIGPYFNRNLNFGTSMMSYVVPIFRNGNFMGVVGMDIDFDVFANLISSIRVYDNGYAFLLNNEGEIMYHPTLSMDNRLENLKYEIVDKSENANHIVKYKYGSNSKRAAMRRLTNGLHLYVTVLEEEVSRNWTRLIWLFAMMSGGILLLFAGLTVFFTNRFTAPLIRLTEAAKKIESGSYDVTLDYDGKDEVGILTTTFNHLTKHLKKYINDLNSKVYTDALTSVRNKLAFTVMTSNLQERISASVGKLPEFAVGIFDCNFLKKVNDIHGHEKGDIYLRLACQHICKIFQHSPVFRIGGDEFAVILQQQDFQDREALEQRFVTKSAENNAATENAWEKIYLAKGIAVYDPAIDHSVSDVIKRADELMYQNKSEMKSGRQD